MLRARGIGFLAVLDRAAPVDRFRRHCDGQPGEARSVSAEDLGDREVNSY
jgi:hypothetical protein